MRFLTTFLVFCLATPLLAQEDIPTLIPDEKYLEDQFYMGLTFNILFEEPQGVTQQNLSYGLFGGFIKDLPLNKNRNFGLGIGLGYSVNSYYTNLQAIETGDGITYSIIDSQTSFKRNKIETHSLELPVEIRLRSSNAISHKFWRVYTGVKFGYVFSARSKFVSDTDKISFSNDDVGEFQYGLIFSFGYNTFNIHAYYALQELFDSGTRTVDGDGLGFVPLNIGLVFYIL